MDQFIDFQQNMMISACINWTLNMFFDVVVLKMLTVYFTLQAKSREQAIKVQVTINSIVKFFLTSYLFLGIVMNIFSYYYLEDFSKNRKNQTHQTLKKTVITIIGGFLALVDFAMLFVFLFTA
jgi:H+/Cl- antiporter ClcA